MGCDRIMALLGMNSQALCDFKGILGGGQDKLARINLSSRLLHFFKALMDNSPWLYPAGHLVSSQ